MEINSIQFLLNDQRINLTDIDPNATVLQYLREHRSITGTKEGCGSGDCGACTVVVAELEGKTDSSRLKYKSINACITFIGSLHGKQLITVEHLKQEQLKQGQQLCSIQQNMVDNHASQCGFCTPGIVMSCYALQQNSHQKSQQRSQNQNNQTPNREDVVQALAGNLCRCTGYRSIIDAAMQSTQGMEANGSHDRNNKTISLLNAINASEEIEFVAKNKSYFSPNNIKALSEYLLANPQSTLLSGGTDLALNVTQNLAQIERLVYLGKVTELNNVTESSKTFTIGSAVVYSDFEPLFQKYYPELGAMIKRIGATQVRNTGTLGGNIGNASPIGDMPPALIALSAKMTLQLGNKTRDILVEDYFVDYKKTVLNPSEFIKEFIIAKPNSYQILKVYKISKRFDDDISALLVACSIEIVDQLVKNIKIAFGGMAAIPKRAINCEKALIDKTFDQANIDLAKRALEKDFQPLSDVRATAGYRMKVAQNIMQKFYLEINQQKTNQQGINQQENTQQNILTRVTDYA